MMNDDAMKISDEMLAAYLDGNSIPLERLLIDESLTDESTREVLELVADCKNAEALEQVESIPMEDIVERLTRPFHEYEELKSGLDQPKNDPIM